MSTKLRLDEIGQLNQQLNVIEDALTKVVYVRQVINSVTAIVFDKQSPVAIELPTNVIERIVQVIEEHLTKERDEIIDKASVLIK